VPTPTISAQEWLNPGQRMRCKGVYLGRIGEFNGGAVKLTEERLEKMQRSNFPPGTHRPRHHIGHPEPTFIGEQRSIGYYEKLYRDGDYLRGDLAGVNPWDAQEISEHGGYPERSMELMRDGDGYEMLACGSLGSSAPGIPGMPPITPEMWEWMEENESALAADTEVLYLSAAGRETFVLQTTTEPHTTSPTEEKMSEVTQAQLDALELKLSQKYDSALAAKDEEIASLKSEVESGKDELRNVHAGSRLALATGKVERLSRDLQNKGHATPGQVNEGKLDAVLLHAEMNCPAMTIDGKSVPFIDALSKLLESGLKLSANRNFSVAPPRETHSLAASGDEAALAAARAYQEEHKCSLQEAVQALARKEASNVA